MGVAYASWFKPAQCTNIRPARAILHFVLSQRTVRETERMSLPFSGNNMTPPYQESEKARKQRLARVRARRRQRLASETAKKWQTWQRETHFAREPSLGAVLRCQKREKLDFINFKLVNSSDLRLKRRVRLDCMDFSSVKSSDLQLKTHATTQRMHAHVVVSPARQQCTALTSKSTIYSMSNSKDPGQFLGFPRHRDRPPCSRTIPENPGQLVTMGHDSLSLFLRMYRKLVSRSISSRIKRSL